MSKSQIDSFLSVLTKIIKKKLEKSKKVVILQLEKSKNIALLWLEKSNIL